jgi:predicted RNA-binding Zn ribbon-like protein
MSGERAPALGEAVKRWRELSLPQPGGRSPAPGQLVLVQSFINSHYDLVLEHGRDLIRTPESLADWLAARRLIAGHPGLKRSDVERAIVAREGLRALAYVNNGGSRRPDLTGLNVAARDASLEIRFADGAPQFISVGNTPLDRALGVILAIAAAALIDGSFSRLKACPGDDCGWAFYDHSRNQSGRWCSMSVCGARAKARSHYRRHRRRGD